MGRLIGKNLFYISRIENGRTKPSLETVLAYHILFEIEVDKLIPEFYQNVHTLLKNRIDEHSYLIADKDCLLKIKERLNMTDCISANNKTEYEK